MAAVEPAEPPEPAEDSDSASTASDIPVLLPVALENAVGNGTAALEHDKQRRRAGVEAVARQDKEGLIHLIKARPTIMRWFNGELRRRHGVAIAGYDELPGGETAILVRQESPMTLRRCKYDCQLYTLGETLSWALMRRRATVDWVLEFWDRDFS